MRDGKRLFWAAAGIGMAIVLALVPATATAQVGIDVMCVLDCGDEDAEEPEVECGGNDAEEGEDYCEEDGFGEMTVEWAYIYYCSEDADCDGDGDLDETTAEITLLAHDCGDTWCEQKINFEQT